MPEYIKVKTNREYNAAAQLFSEYAAWLSIDLNFQHFDAELQNLRIVYNDAEGGIILCKNEKEFIGSIAIRKITNEIAELKRMYVQAQHQQKGIGQQLLKAAIVLAKNLNYKYIRLDTLSHMVPAINLYKKNGFYEIAPYYHNPVSTAVYYEMKL